MSEAGQLLLAIGLLGAVVALGYERACAWADLALLTPHARRRVDLCRRRRTELLATALTLATAGVLVGLL
jgi:hypothetical protein